MLREEVRRVLNKQSIDIDHVPLDQQVIGPLAKLHQGAGNDIDEPPGEFPEGCAVPFT